MIAMARRRMLPRITHDHSLLPCIHVDDAASATVAALDHGQPGAVYDIVDDRAVSFSDIVAAHAEASGAQHPYAIPARIPRIVLPGSKTDGAHTMLSRARRRCSRSSRQIGRANV